SADVSAHTQTQALLVHHSELAADGAFARPDETIPIEDEPDHEELCHREQQFFLRAVRDDLDLSDHWQGAYDSLRIVLAADQSRKEGRTIAL
ncbi:MAG TPA: hypothetical protein PKK95_11585, partial [Vicinamibacterales bacterium]|nr:hypothetical protein [Vicinamibacterales bacterium]